MYMKVSVILALKQYQRKYSMGFEYCLVLQNETRACLLELGCSGLMKLLLLKQYLNSKMKQAILKTLQVLIDYLIDW